MPRSIHTPRTMARLQRNGNIIDLRKAGLTYEAISQQLDVTLTTCRKVVSEAMRRLLTVDRESLDEVLAIEVERTYTMLQAIWPKVLAGQERAIWAALKIQERRAKYLGLDAAERLDVSLTGGMTIQTDTPQSAAEEIRERMAEMRTRLLEAPGDGVATNGHAAGVEAKGDADDSD